MRINLSCPAEVFQVSPPTEETASGEITLFNLSDRVIASVEATLRLYSAEGQETEKVVYRARALNGRPHATFRMQIPCSFMPGTARAEATVEKVWFTDNDVWRRKPGTEVEYTPNALPVSQALTALKFAAGETAVGFPSRQEGLWVCVCGRPNPEREEVCLRCRRGREEVFARFNRDAVENLISQQERRLELKSRSALEDTARLQREREAEYEKERRRRSSRIRIALALLGAAGVTAAAVFWVEPAARLWSGKQTMEAGDLSRAKAVFASLGGYPGAAEAEAEADFRLALQRAEEAREPEEMAAAAQALRADGRDEALRKAAETDFRRAEALMRAGQYAEAEAILETLDPETEGLSALKQENAYLKAKADMEGRYYVLAREAFLALGDYRDAAQLADACVYEPARELMAAGDYAAAIRQLTRIPEYEDSAALIRECQYRMGLALEEEGDLAGAAEAFFAAGDTEDAQARARSAAGTLGDAAFAGGDYETALAWYERMGDDPAGLEQARGAILVLARQAFSDQENRRTLQWLDMLPADYPGAGELRIQATMALAEKAEAQAKWQEVIALLSPFEAEKDCREALDQARIALAKEKMAEGELFEAQELLSAVQEGNREAEQLMKQLVVSDEEE